MALTTIGATVIASALVQDSAYNLFGNATAALGVGDSTTAFSAAQTDLQAATNKSRKAMVDATYPSRSGAAITLRALWDTSSANWTWNEWATFNTGAASSGGQMLQRKVESLGTKTSAQSWQLTATLTVAAA